MEGEQQDSYGMMHHGDISIPIPLLIPVSEPSKGSDSGLHGANLKPSPESGPYSASNGTATMRRRHTEPSSSTRSSTMKRSYYPIRSRVLQVEESHSPRSNATPESRNALYKKIKSMKSGILQSDSKRGEDDNSSDEKDDSDDADDDKEDAQDKAAGEVQKGLDGEEKRRKCRTFGKKLKAYDVIIEWILFIFTMVLLVASLYADDLKARAIWGLEIWKWCVLVAVIFCGRLVTKWAKDCIVFLIETKFLFNEKVVYFIHGVKQSVRFAIWLALVLIAWVLLIDKKHTKHSKETSKVLSYITKALVSSLIGAVMWMVKTLLVKFIAATFHVKTFFVKIREAVSDEYVLWTLSVPRSIEFKEDGGQAKGSYQISWLKLPKWMKGRVKKCSIEEKIHQEENITLKELGRMKPGKMPASTMGQLIDRIKSSKLSFVSSAIDMDPDYYDDNGNEQTKITSRSEAEIAASLIFKNVANKDHPKYITKKDLLDFENKENKDCLNQWFLKVAEEEKITEADLSEWVVNIYKQREYLSHSLKDAKTAIEELNRLLSGLVVILILIVWLLLMGFATTKVLLFCSSQILLVGFMFGNTCRTLFEAMIFVFVMHPFDVGDRCVIDGVQMIVEEMDILKTAFLRYDSEMIYYPNSVLATKAISNFNRSPEKMGDSVCFDIDVATPVASIQALKAEIKKYVEEKPHHWHPDQTLQIKEIENMNKMKMVLFINHRMNFQDYLEKMNRRTELMLALKQMFEDIGIKYHLLPQQLHINQIGPAIFPESASAAYPRAI